MPRLAAICDGFWPCRLSWPTWADSETETVSPDDCGIGACLGAVVAAAGVASDPAESAPEMESDIRELFLSRIISAECAQLFNQNSAFRAGN
jgi:hypothetical protein